MHRDQVNLTSLPSWAWPARCLALAILLWIGALMHLLVVSRLLARQFEEYGIELSNAAQLILAISSRAQTAWVVTVALSVLLVLLVSLITIVVHATTPNWISRSWLVGIILIPLASIAIFWMVLGPPATQVA